MRVLTVVGARPQLIKAEPVSQALKAAGHEEILVDTGQHFDHRMSGIFFDELGLRPPDVALGAGPDEPGARIATMLSRLEPVIARTAPDFVLVYGDTDSTLAGALAASIARVPLAHVEAGLRSFNRDMPEERNRILTDHASDLLLCPTETAVANLEREGVTVGVHLVGDVMFDAMARFLPIARSRVSPLERLGVEPGAYALATIHRPANVDDPATLRTIAGALSSLPMPVVLPMHPRTRARAGAETGLWGDGVRVVEPLGYLDMLVVEDNAAVILTDSGGVQKEAWFLGVPCVTLRRETEWVETVETGWNTLVGADPERIVEAVRTRTRPERRPRIPRDAEAAPKIVEVLERFRR